MGTDLVLRAEGILGKPNAFSTYKSCCSLVDPIIFKVIRSYISQALSIKVMEQCKPDVSLAIEMRLKAKCGKYKT